MTEKRYKMKCHEINSWYIEKDGKVLIFDLFKSDAEILYAELNSLSDENEQLKSTNMEMEDYLGRLEEQIIVLSGQLDYIQNSISELFDKKIEALEDDLERSVKAGMSTSTLYDELDELETLKEEIMELWYR